MDYSLLEELREKLNSGTVGKRAAIGILAIMLIAIAFAGRMMLFPLEGHDEFEIAKTAEVSSEQPVDIQDESILVHVAGAVQHPGMVEVATGGRVADAVEAAGGFSEDAATDSVNLARQVEDGEQIKIPTLGELAAAESQNQEAIAGGNATNAPAEMANGKVNINTATAQQLTSLPGVGEATAAKIIADRESNGSFKTPEDLKRVSGIGDKKYEALADLICV